jgi:hypothetical protein
MGSESWALEEENRSKLEMFHHSCLRRICTWTMGEIAEKQITNEKVRKTAKLTHNGIDEGICEDADGSPNSA